MTQEELDALLNENILDEADEQKAKVEAKEEVPEEQFEDKHGKIDESKGIKAADFRIDSDASWPPPPPTVEHKVVHQLDDVTRDSEVKATETFDKLELISNAGMDIEEGLAKIENFINSQEDMLQKLHSKFPNFHTFSQKLEEIADSFEGVEKSFAIQAGREIRVMVKPDKISDDKMTSLARDVAKKVENEMDYPGQIKVNIIRETRVVDYAK